jgi:hypothetical protein
MHVATCPWITGCGSRDAGAHGPPSTHGPGRLHVRLDQRSIGTAVGEIHPLHVCHPDRRFFADDSGQVDRFDLDIAPHLFVSMMGRWTADPSPDGRRVVLLNFDRVIRAARHRPGENPAFVCRYSLLAPVEHNLRRPSIKRNAVR